MALLVVAPIRGLKRERVYQYDSNDAFLMGERK